MGPHCSPTTPAEQRLSNAGSVSLCPTWENHSDLAKITFKSLLSCCLRGSSMSLALGLHAERLPPCPWAPGSECASVQEPPVSSSVPGPSSIPMA